MKLRTGDPWMPGSVYGRALRGLTLNLLVRHIDAALPFHREVLGAEVVYSDPDFAVLRYGEVEWMLHADHTYLEHPLHPSLAEAGPRGVGAELRLHGRDPDAAEAAARRLGLRCWPGQPTSRTACVKCISLIMMAISGCQTCRGAGESKVERRRHGGDDECKQRATHSVRA